MPALYILLSLWILFLPALPLAAERCEEETTQALCSDTEAGTEDCCSLGEACSCCLAFVLPEVAALSTDAAELQQPQSLYPSLSTPLISPAIWHPPKG